MKHFCRWKIMNDEENNTTRRLYCYLFFHTRMVITWFNDVRFIFNLGKNQTTEEIKIALNHLTWCICVCSCRWNLPCVQKISERSIDGISFICTPTTVNWPEVEVNNFYFLYRLTTSAANWITNYYIITNLRFYKKTEINYCK